MKRNVTKNISIVLLVFFVLFAFSEQNYASHIEVDADYDLKMALDYAFNSDIDSLILTTDGGIYATEDTAELVIKEPLTIVADEGLAESGRGRSDRTRRVHRLPAGTDLRRRHPFDRFNGASPVVQRTGPVRTGRPRSADQHVRRLLVDRQLPG